MWGEAIPPRPSTVYMARVSQNTSGFQLHSPMRLSFAPSVVDFANDRSCRDSTTVLTQKVQNNFDTSDDSSIDVEDEEALKPRTRPFVLTSSAIIGLLSC
jgi:hypothetical protein